ncbi:MAG: hypothetical protein CMI18_04565 [Opitutaceae bacterium]|nr:hypothetical protein [Opitutaceae bacterium]
MTFRLLPLIVFYVTSVSASVWSEIPQLPHKLVEDWPDLPKGWNLGETVSVDVDSDDNIWVFHRGENGVIQFDRHGKILDAWKNMPIESAHGLQVDAEDNIWLVDVSGHRIMKCDRNGRIRMVIANAGMGTGDNDAPYGFNRPTGLAFAPNGDVYVADGYVNSRVVKYTADGKYITHWGSKGIGDGQFNLVHDVTVDNNGRVYVADRTNARIQVFDANGKFIELWPDVGNPWGVHYVASQDAIYMADGHANRILKLNTDGGILGQLSQFGKAPGDLDFAHHLSVDSEGSIYVTEIKNWRVQKFAIPKNLNE